METQQQLRRLYQNCITGSHVLHYHGILDAYGHLSFRHPSTPSIFIMPRNMAPANIASPQDLVEYNVSDATPVDSNAPAGYIERYIHSEIYKRYPGVNSVIHSHASAVVPYTISGTGVPLKPCLHMAGFLGPSTPVYDVAKHYEPGTTRDLLIRSLHLGESLAACFRAADASTQTGKDEPDHSVVLMRGHGYTVAARSIEECVFRAIYTRENAAIQTASLGLSAAYRGTGEPPTEIHYLRDDEIEGATGIALTGWARAWGLWVREVEAANLYATSG